MAISQDIKAKLQALDEELGLERGFDAPEGIHHYRIHDDTEVLSMSDGSPSLRVVYEVKCGPYIGRRFSDFVSYFAAEGSESSKSFEERQEMRAKMAYRRVTDLMYSAGEAPATMMGVARGLKALNPMKAEPEEVKELLETLAESITGLEGYVQAKKPVSRDGKAPKYDGMRYTILAADSRKATCECSEK